ncbi:hemerythrin domain-containing protein [Actinoplanes sp. TFC3]|uniref:hemerythrin domain-containing protein n=1 Tax=Actinoplanes sp. TFC3 TaxID=1710355 RepID=UPI0008306651|nr:hemerythrin domain-containing protein [Actinoplanes sp. TFC3]
MAALSDEYSRFLAYGNQLVAVHVRLRDMLDDILDGVVPPVGLATHCVAFCAAVTKHHTGEDREVFPLLAERHPELRSFLDGLTRDHEVISGLLERVITLAGDPLAVHAELSGLSAILTTHFLGEEKRLTAVLNALDPSVGLTALADY